jgi:hypothetical protein
MRTPATSQYKLARFAAGLLAAFLCAGPARAQFVSTAVTNLSSPSGVAVDANNNLYITDTYNNRVALFNANSSTLTTLAGSGKVGTNNGTGTQASFYLPWGIVGARGGLVVADWGSSVIRYVSYAGVVSNLAGQAFVYGSVNGAAATATFSFPTGLATDSAGNIYVADSQNGAVREIDTNNNVTTLAGGFALPNALAVDADDNVWVTDAGANAIYMISQGVVTLEAGIPGQAGANDSPVALDAQFNSPSGLLWLANESALYISDTGNDTIRSLFMTNGAYAVQTVAGLAGQPGFVNGSLAVAQFNQPIGLALDPTDFGYYVADSGNKAVRVLLSTAPQPAITAPILGYVSFPPSAFLSQFIPSTSAVFNNLTNIAVETEEGTETYMSYGPTGSFIPQPSPATGVPDQIYPGDGTGQAQITSAIMPGPGTNDITVYAIGVQSGRQSSPIVSARYQFITANPTIFGDNAANILLSDVTLGASLYYTLNYGTNLVAPTNDGSSFGPVGSGTVLSILITNNAVLEVRAFADGLATSQIVSALLSIANFQGNLLTFGFANGVASTHFHASPGETFSAPVTLTLLSNANMTSFQFDLTLTNSTGASLASFNPRFESSLMHQATGSPPLYHPIPPGIVVPMGTNYGVASGIFTNDSEDTFEIAWLETDGETNLYNTTIQELLSYSVAADTLFTAGGGQVVVGSFEFDIPLNANPCDTYTLLLSRPSGSAPSGSSVVPVDVIVQAPTTDFGGISALQSLTVLPCGSFPYYYLVGDVYPLSWYNIGDFGDQALFNDDVIQTFNSAIYRINVPPANTDYYDAMDSSSGYTNNWYTASDSYIDSLTLGDGQLNVDDVYVTLRRSLDPALLWVERYWTNGARSYFYTNNTYADAGQPPPSPHSPPVQKTASGPRYITVAADQIQAGANSTVQVPIRVLVADSLPVRVLMLNVEIDPLDGSPPIVSSINFSTGTNLGAATLTASQGANNYGAAWLDSTVSGVSGTGIIGTLAVTLPSNVTANSAYLVHFDHFSASPNGIALFHTTVQDGLITVGNRTGSSWNDGIPDTWRLLYFGTVSNILSAANADPDGDGASNWDEFVAGTNPQDATSVFKFAPSTVPGGGYFTLQWPSVLNKTYAVQSASSPAGGWTTLATNLIGNNQTMQWTDTNAASGTRFYRASVQ